MQENKVMDLDYKTTSTIWGYAYEFTWYAGMIMLIIYTFLSWPHYYSDSRLDEYYVQFSIYGLFYLGMIGARWRYLQYKNLRMFCITLGGSLFICVMTLHKFDMVGQPILEMAVWVYALAMVFVLSFSIKR